MPSIRPFRALGLLAALAALIVVAFALGTMPARQFRVTASGWRPRLPGAVVRGTYHVHTNRSDGSGSLNGIAAAAARAGLEFVIVTDHGDATRPVEPPQYRSGVLVIDAVEISTNGGHLAALDVPLAPYPLAGEAAAVVEDVSRLGGFGIATHPDSPKRSLTWRDWTLPIDGFEWLSADSEWRDESRRELGRAMLHYALRAPQAVASVFDRPEATLHRWDRLGSEGRRLVALAGADAHARLGWRGGPDDLEEGPPNDAAYVPLPSYETVFRSFSLRVELDGPLGRQPALDARRVVDAIRSGRVFTVIDALAAPGAFEFFGEHAGGVARMGTELPPGRPVQLVARTAAPAGATIVIYRNGVAVARSTGLQVVHDSQPHRNDPEFQVFRAEVHVPGWHPGQVPWIVGNPIYVGDYASRRSEASSPAAPTAASASLPVVPERRAVGKSLMNAEWHVERDPDSVGAVQALQAPARSLVFRFGLADNKRDAFVAVAHGLERPIGPGKAVRLRARSSRPVRISVQVRLGDPVRDLRWRRSVFLDQDARDYVLPVDQLEAVARDVPTERRSMADGLLLVLDRTNTRGGTTGVVWVEDVALIDRPPVRSAP